MTQMEDDIIVISDHIEIHPNGSNYSVVRDGAVYGTYADLDYARKLAKELAEATPRLPAELLGILEALKAWNPQDDHFTAIRAELVQVLEVENTPATFDPTTNSLTCPHCQFVGIAQGEPQPGKYGIGFYYLEDANEHRDCDLIHDGQMNISTEASSYAEDGGRFSRIECRDCLRESAIPDNLGYDFV